jgi:uncharacterized membrane-anchored protein
MVERVDRRGDDTRTSDEGADGAARSRLPAARLLGALCLLALLTPGPARAEAGQPVALPWQQGPMTARIGSNLAEISLSDEYIFLDADGTRSLLELTQNPVSGSELATVAPASDDQSWFLIFEFEDIGYVPDDEKGKLDADDILESIRAGNEAANEERRKRGWAPMSIVGWHEPPHYDERTNNLSWAIIGESQGHRTINRMVKLLGRRGVMTTTLVCSPENLDASIAQVDGLLDGYSYRPGNTYAEYVPGRDKLAEYGLAALVVGGGAAVLAKTGILARLWKPIAVALAALGASLKRFFFGGRSSKHDPEKPIA